MTSFSLIYKERCSEGEQLGKDVHSFTSTTHTGCSPAIIKGQQQSNRVIVNLGQQSNFSIPFQMYHLLAVGKGFKVSKESPAVSR